MYGPVLSKYLACVTSWAGRNLLWDPQTPCVNNDFVLNQTGKRGQGTYSVERGIADLTSQVLSGSRDMRATDDDISEDKVVAA